MTPRFLTISRNAKHSDLESNSVAHYWLLHWSHEQGGVMGFVEHDTHLNCSVGRFALSAGMYFAANGPINLGGGSGLCVVTPNYSPQFMVGGPIESKGRLKYIDGCTDSLLIPPTLLGDPCLNALYFPPRILQTMHTHPSVRIGLVVAGAGLCLTPEKNTPLEPGVCFVIEKDALHHFSTDDSSMVVVAYHPDSDYGPKHEDHPMINRTIVDGVSAKEIKAIQTK